VAKHLLDFFLAQIFVGFLFFCEIGRTSSDPMSLSNFYLFRGRTRSPICSSFWRDRTSESDVQTLECGLNMGLSSLISKKDVLGGPKDGFLEISAIRSKALRHRAPSWSLRSFSRVATCLSVDAAQHRSSPCASPSFITQYQTSNQKLVNQQTLTLFSVFVE